MADLPFEPADAGSTQRLLRAVDAEGKIPRALEAHGSFAGLDVVLFGASPERARWLEAAGARLAVVADAATEEAWPPPESADVVVAFWTAFDGPDRAEQLANAARLLRPSGRLLVVLDYGRDDLDVVRGPERTAELVASSRRDGWFLSRGFRVRVIHTFWQFETIEEAGELLRAAYGPAAEPAIGRLRRPRLAHNVAVYSWTREGALPDALAVPSAGRAGSMVASRAAGATTRRAPKAPDVPPAAEPVRRATTKSARPPAAKPASTRPAPSAPDEPHAAEPVRRATTKSARPPAAQPPSARRAPRAPDVPPVAEPAQDPNA